MRDFKKKFKEKARAWKRDITIHRKQISIALLFLFVAIILDYIAGYYTTEKAVSTEVQDLILDHIPAINLNFLFVWLFILVIVIILIYPLIFKPDKLHYYLGLLSSFIVTRSGFVILTHLKTPAEAIPVDFPFYADKLFFLNDSFFSGHTGLPFLAFLIIQKENKTLGYLMLACSIILGITSLLMHQHYSIDVFAAFFITYGIYKLGDKIFDHEKT